ncbi:MAG: DUF1275 domain-containing protein [Solirubrobacteraceae bacterium]|nr:DUF1275 domain-containing protein [Solirubrobacteraceae bacterium]
MTFATGLIDAVSYLAIGSVFTANMTGNVVLLGFGLGGVDAFPVDRALLALVAFAAGGVAAGRLARTWHHAPFVWFRRVTAIEIVLVGLAGGLLVGLPAGIETPDEPRRYGAIAVLGLAMGLRNATVRRLGFKDVPTTVLTSTVTDLATDSRLGGGERRNQGIRLAAILAMLAGAVIGALLIGVSALAALGAAEVILLAVAAHQAYVARTVPGQRPPSPVPPDTSDPGVAGPD